MMFLLTCDKKLTVQVIGCGDDSASNEKPPQKDMFRVFNTTQRGAWSGVSISSRMRFLDFCFWGVLAKVCALEIVILICNSFYLFTTRNKNNASSEALQYW